MQSSALHTTPSTCPALAARLRTAASRVASRAGALPLGIASIALAVLASCSRTAAGPVVTVHAASGDAVVTVEMALTREAQARGLMYRTELAEDAGMLFVFDREEERWFWMSNTPIPLDILFIRSDASIATIAARTTPYSERQIPSRVPVRYVLEVPGGWSERHGVKTGDRVTLPGTDAAASPGD